MDNASLKVFEKEGKLKVRVYVSPFRGHPIRLTFTVKEWEAEVIEGTVDFTICTEEMDTNWIYAECECPKYYKWD